MVVSGFVPLFAAGFMLLELEEKAFKLILVSLAGWMNQQQQRVIEYLQEEIRVLKEQRGSRGPKFTDEQRRRLAIIC